MKKILVSLMLSCFLLNAEAQTKTKQKKPASKAVVKGDKKAPAKSPGVIVLNNLSNNKAYASSSVARLQIADTTINIMNKRAAGANILFDDSLIAGMPKRAYGFANGKILLRNTTATTSGAAFGSGAVGTGTSIFGTGTSESVIGVNGKSPDAGPWLWGDRRPVYIGRDSVKRQ